jgi:hypothetical protein
MKQLILCFVVLLASQMSKAQELESILIAADDAEKLTENYLNPAVKGVMYSMNGGWYTTAKTHKKFGFDITISANASFIPSKDEVFAFFESDYSFLSLPNGEATLPTVMSSNDSETIIDVSVPVGDGTFKVASFEMPGGIADDLPLNAAPAPMIQVGLGLPFNTDLKARFVPNIKFDDDVEANLIGFGLQHDIMQYLGPLDKLPLNVSILGAFTTMKVAYDIPDDSISDDVTVTNGEAEFKMNTWTIQAVASLDFRLLTIYGGIGYNNGTSTVKMKGDYQLNYDIEDDNGQVVGTVTENISDPMDIDFDANGVRGTLGARLNLGVFKIFADYTVQEYNTASAGIAFSFR